MEAKQYVQGREVHDVRRAIKGDDGFVEGEDQVVVTFGDGKKKTVKRSEMTKE